MPSSGSFCPSASRGISSWTAAIPISPTRPCGRRHLAKKGIHFLGVGISGGELGARQGPSIMPGGPREAYIWVKSIFEAIAADVHGEPCVSYLGPGSAGHFVKMVHNGIEYAMMELIAEAYDLMKRGLGLTDDELAGVFEKWDGQTFHAYLMEITARIFRHVDEKTGKRLIDEILDEARQKGTGKWTSQAAMDLQVPVPVIDAAVAMRDLSAFKEEREAASRILAEPPVEFKGPRKSHPGAARRGPVRGHPHRLCPGDGPAPGCLIGLRIQPQSVGSGPHLARGLHHPLGPAGRDPSRVEEPPRRAEPARGAAPVPRGGHPAAMTCRPWSARRQASGSRHLR